MRFFKIIGVSILISLFFVGCKTPQKVDKIYVNNQFQTECLGTHNDGSHTLRAWGKGKNKAIALENARKAAVSDVIFKGISAGSGECTKKPILNEVNARERYESFFNSFFSEGGDYMRFSSLADEKSHSRLKSSSKDMENWGAVVTVDCAALRQYLIDQGILNLN